MKNKELNIYLKFGYFFEYQNKDIAFDFSRIDRRKYIGCSEEELISKGKEAFIESIAKNYEPNHENLVPLSGGLDSRAILGGLLEHTEATKIFTYTFGLPGTLDFEIGNKIAKSIGTNHTEFPLTEYKYTLKEHLKISKLIDHQTSVFLHPPVLKILDVFTGCRVWSGYMGGELAGGKIVDNPSSSIKEAKRYFIRNTAIKIKSVPLSNLSEDDAIDLIQIDLIDTDKLSYEEQLNFQIRQTRQVAPHVLFRGMTYKLPFINEVWLNFILGVSNKNRKGKILFIKILQNSFPFLFDFPTKNSYGLPLNANKLDIFVRKCFKKSQELLNRKNIYINYLDFDKEIRNRDDLKTLVYQNIMDLKARRIVEWIDIDSIWKTHIYGKANLANALMVLASLEFHLKAGKKI